jgi:phosphonate transport system substrate-binding protein
MKGSMKNLKARYLLAALLATLILGVAMAGNVGQGGAPPFRIGFSTTLFTDVNDVDAKASIKVWAQTVARERGINMHPTAQLYDHIEDLVGAMQRDEVDAVSLTFDEYVLLAEEVETDHWFLTRTTGTLYEEYILLANADAGIEDLEALEGHTILLHRTARTGLAPDWLDHAVISRGFAKSAKSYFGSISEVGKASAAVLPVFFGKADAAVVADSHFEVMAELNPQLRRKLKVIAKSPPLVPAIMCFRKEFESPEKERLMAALGELHMTPAGEQVLTIFQSQALVQVDEGPLRATAAFVEEARNLRRNGAADGKSSEGSRKP